MKKRLFLLFLSALAATAMAQEADTTSVETTASNSSPHFISDKLFVYMHTGPGSNYRIKGSVNAGSNITVLQVDAEAGYTEVNDDRGRSGWVKSEFVSQSPSLNMQIDTLKAQLEEVTASASNQSNEVLKLQRELALAKQDGEDKLRESQQLQEQLEQLKLKQQRQSDTEKKDMLFAGGAIAGIGLVIGLILPVLFRRRKRPGDYFDRL